MTGLWKDSRVQNQESCPKCKGEGRIKVDSPGWEAHPGLVCALCDGSGQAMRARLKRAYSCGYWDGVAAQQAAVPNPWDSTVKERMDRHNRQIWQGDLLDDC